MNNKIKHLEMIQNIIDRMARNSFALKGWTVALATMIITLINLFSANPLFLFVPYIPPIIFYLLDAYYLSLERKYRELYDIVLEKKEDEIDFKLSYPKGNKENKTRYWDAIKSYTEWLFYLGLIVLITIVVLCVTLK